jgi:hypothetical protein
LIENFFGLSLENETPTPILVRLLVEHPLLLQPTPRITRISKHVTSKMFFCKLMVPNRTSCKLMLPFAVIPVRGGMDDLSRLLRIHAPRSAISSVGATATPQAYGSSSANLLVK